MDDYGVYQALADGRIDLDRLPVSLVIRPVGTDVLVSAIRPQDENFLCLNLAHEV